MSKSDKSSVQNEQHLEAQVAELKKRLVIDPMKLTEAMVEQSTLMLAAREAVVDCTALRDGVKHDLEVYAAKHDAEVREEALNAGEKLTEARIAAMVASDPGTIEWKYSLIDANALLGKAQALADSYLQRSWMLRELAQIHAPFERDRQGGLAPPSA